MDQHLLTRRQFAARCALLAAALPAASALSFESTRRTVTLPDGTAVSAVGQGGWHLGQNVHSEADEQEALRTGISLGMTLIDTSGNYGNGRSESFLGKAIGNQRDRVFLVSKVESTEVSGDGIAKACAASLARLGTDHLDLYLMHWPVATNEFPGMVAAFEQLKAAGKIRAWGVSNFNRRQMENLFNVPNGQHCATNQVPYSLNNRAIERDLLPWCELHNMPLMAYSPLGGDKSALFHDPRLAKIGAARGVSAAAVALAWVVRSGKIIAIPESGTPTHTKENAAALSLTLTPQELQTLA